MICGRISPLLDGLVDGSLTSAESSLVREHLKECARCREEEAWLRELVAAAARLSAVQEPRRDLWPAIEARIATKAPPARGRVGRSWERAPWIASLAAALLVAVLLAVALRSGSIGRRTSDPHAGMGAAVPAVVDLEGAGARYEAARRELAAALAARRSELAPATLRTIDENLAVIDAAVAQIVTALERDPHNRELAGLLVATWDRQAAALQRFVRVIGRG